MLHTDHCRAEGDRQGNQVGTAGQAGGVAPRIFSCSVARGLGARTWSDQKQASTRYSMREAVTAKRG